MKTLSKLQQLSFIIRREFLAISTSYAVLLVLMGGIIMNAIIATLMNCLLWRSRMFLVSCLLTMKRGM